MATKVFMPKQGLQMTEGTIMKWIVSEGEQVQEGEPLFEMETDKLTIAIDASASGTLLKIVEPEGAVVPITETIAIIGDPGEDISDLLKSTNALPLEPSLPETQQVPPVTSSASHTANSGRKFSTPRARWQAVEANIDIINVPAAGPNGLVIEKDVLEYVHSGMALHKASPLASVIAGRQGIDLAAVKGTGARGKIMKSDLLSIRQPAILEDQKKDFSDEDVVIPLRGMRGIIAKRMRESLQFHAQLTHVVKVDMTNAADLRNTFKEENIKITFNDLILYAAAKALKEFPIANSISTEDSIIQKNHVNLGMAVAIDAGLIVPNIKHAERMGLRELSAAAKELAEKARENKLQPEDLDGGTFTVSNLGAYGLDCFTAIINQSETGILAAGAMERTAVLTNEDDMEFEFRPIMKLTLSYDHRVLDGAPAADFLMRIKKYIEHPSLML